MKSNVNSIIEITHQVQKALNTNACINKKYIENAKPKTTSQKIGVKEIVPAAKRRVKIRIAIYIPSPAKALGMPNVLLNLLY